MKVVSVRELILYKPAGLLTGPTYRSYQNMSDITHEIWGVFFTLAQNDRVWEEWWEKTA